MVLYGWETWPVRVADERMLVVFDNDSIRHILHMRCINSIIAVGLRWRLQFTNTTEQLVQRGTCGVGHTGRRPKGKLIRHLFPSCISLA